jgi:hypothetical protein
MTQDREETLISDVAETKGMLNRFLKEWDERKPLLASCADVEIVDKRLTLHIDEGKHRGASVGMWVASISAGIAAIAAIFGVKL